MYCNDSIESVNEKFYLTVKLLCVFIFLPIYCRMIKIDYIAIYYFLQIIDVKIFIYQILLYIKIDIRYKVRLI